MDFNLLLDTDSYKGSHWLQYPSDLTAMGAYLESRGGENPATLFFGLQMLLQDTLTRPVSQSDLEEAAELWNGHGLPFNRAGFRAGAIGDLRCGAEPLRSCWWMRGQVIPSTRK